MHEGSRLVFYQDIDQGNSISWWDTEIIELDKRTEAISKGKLKRFIFIEKILFFYLNFVLNFIN